MSANSNLATELSMGNAGFGLVTATTLQSGNYVGLVTTTPTIFASISGRNVTGTWSGNTIPAGITIVGPITSFQLTSGSVIAYNGVINS